MGKSRYRNRDDYSDYSEDDAELSRKDESTKRRKSERRLHVALKTRNLDALRNLDDDEELY